MCCMLYVLCIYAHFQFMIYVLYVVTHVILCCLLACLYIFFLLKCLCQGSAWSDSTPALKEKTLPLYLHHGDTIGKIPGQSFQVS